VSTVILGVTGCIAAYKACEVLRRLQRCGHELRVVMTRHAAHFVGERTFEALSRRPVLIDLFDKTATSAMSHIDWSADADLLLVAPATANVIAKFAHGVADDALTTLYLATSKPVIVAPAMNVKMWSHPATVENVALLRRRGVNVIEPAEGELACGVMGAGRLAEVEKIVAAACNALSKVGDLSGETVLVTAGPTQEDIDAVRFISNRSSGKMGYGLAQAARDRGARVVLIAGPNSLGDLAGVEIVKVRSAEDMARAASERAERATIVLMAAAVCDHKPRKAADGKLKRAQMPESLQLVATPDVLRMLAERKGKRMVVGFAAETENLAENARRKLEEKGIDLIVANDVSRRDRGFGSEQNAAVLIDRKGRRLDLPLMSKRAFADRILDRVVALLNESKSQ
jgi:phosphopantothenoylcysteine decarboxylase/phosphopantothenate--cysteine ligase